VTGSLGLLKKAKKLWGGGWEKLLAVHAGADWRGKKLDLSFGPGPQAGKEKEIR